MTENAGDGVRRDHTARPARTGRGTALAAVGIAAAILAYQILVPPIVGLANDGDFEKIMGPVGLMYLPDVSDSEKYFRWVASRFAFAEPNWWKSGYRTSETVLVRAAMIPARSRNPAVFDIRWIGGLHAALFVLFFASILLDAGRRGRVAALAAAGVGLFFFTDVGYVSVMNSLYSQEASYLALFGIVAVLARSARAGFTALRAAAYFVAAGFFVTSKPQEAPAAVVLALFGAAMTMPRGAFARAVGVTGAALLLGLGVWYYRQISPSMSALALRQVLFDEVLAHSPDPRLDLREMGLDPAWADRSLEQDDRFSRKLNRRFSFPRLFVFYLEHPVRAVGALGRSARAAMVLRPPAYGNLPRSAGVPEREPSRAFGVWSALRARAAPFGGLALVAIFGGAVTAAGRRLLRFEENRVPALALLLLVAMAAVDFGVCSLANSQTDIERHLFAFDAITDLLVGAGVVAAADRIARRRLGPA